MAKKRKETARKAAAKKSGIEKSTGTSENVHTANIVVSGPEKAVKKIVKAAEAAKEKGAVTYFHSIDGPADSMAELIALRNKNLQIENKDSQEHIAGVKEKESVREQPLGTLFSEEKGIDDGQKT